MKWSAALLCMVASTACAQQSDMLTLADAIGLGKANSRFLKVSALKVDAASAKAEEASVAMRPTLKVTGSYTRLSDVDPFRVTVPFYPAPITISPTVLDNYSMRLSLQQPLFTGFRLLSNARAADRLAEASAADLNNDRDDLVLSITAAYWTVYQARETQKFVEENVARLEADEKDAANLVRAGVATRNDLLKIQVQLSNARLSAIDAANDAQLAAMNLNNIIGRPLDTPVTLASTPAGARGEDSVSARDSSRSLVAEALTRRADLAALRSRTEAARASVDAARGGWWPQIMLSGNYYYQRPNVRYLPTRDEFKSTWDIGVVLQFDLWTWGTAGLQTEQAAATLHQNELLYDQLKENISLEVRRATMNAGKAAEKVRVSRLAIEQAEESVRMTKEKFQKGLATSLELLDADVALLQAKTNLSGALVEHAIAIARRDKALGEGK